jgi:hypothetical protein
MTLQDVPPFCRVPTTKSPRFTRSLGGSSGISTTRPAQIRPKHYPHPPCSLATSLDAASMSMCNPASSPLSAKHHLPANRHCISGFITGTGRRHHPLAKSLLPGEGALCFFFLLFPVNRRSVLSCPAAAAPRRHPHAMPLFPG